MIGMETMGRKGIKLFLESVSINQPLGLPSLFISSSEMRQ
jgi:hypothetical protein